MSTDFKQAHPSMDEYRALCNQFNDLERRVDKTETAANDLMGELYDNLEFSPELRERIYEIYKTFNSIK